MKKSPHYDVNVFINCPFDKDYVRLFNAIVFTIHSLGLRPMCALGAIDAEIRIHKILRIIRESKYGIHDISRIQLDEKYSFPRFNMPFELGLDLGCKEFNSKFNDKKHLVLEAESFRFQKYISDIAGFDPRSHSNKTQEIIQIVCDWIRQNLNNFDLPNGRQIHEDFKEFKKDLPEIKKKLPRKLSFPDLSYIMAKWINQKRAVSLN